MVFYFLQLKPLIQNTGRDIATLDSLDTSECFVISGRSMGNGIDTSISDIVWVDTEVFSNMYTMAIAEEIGKLNDLLKESNRRYILIGPGRWGTRDHSLGIPVNFSQISFSRVIVETDMPTFSVEPSQGSHFFHNVTSMNIGYMSVSAKDDHIDWEWLRSLPCEHKLKFCSWSRTPEPCHIIMNGRSGNTVIYKRHL